MALRRIVLALSVMTFAVLSFAAGETNSTTVSSRVYGIKCVESGDNSEVYTCHIGQFRTEAEANKAGGFTMVYSSWSLFMTRYNALTSNMYYDTFILEFDTDFEFGGTNVVDGKTVCAGDAFSPLSNWLGGGVSNFVRGNNHTIKNFCYINNTGNASFFNDLTSTSIQGLNFDGAYVKATSANTSYAGVVANSAQGAEFSDISVKNATVIADIAGGIE